MTDRVPFYDTEHSCVKCGFWVSKHDVRYVGLRMFAQPDMDPHLVRSCRTCHYEWQMETRDHV